MSWLTAVPRDAQTSGAPLNGNVLGAIKKLDLFGSTPTMSLGEQIVDYMIEN